MNRWWAKLQSLLSRDAFDRGIRDEIEEHLRMETEGLVERGMTPQAAQSAARRRFGNRAAMAEQAREAWMFRPVEHFLQDLRYGQRILRRSPAFTFTAVAIIALGIGATTAAFTLLDHVLLRPLPFAQPHRLVTLYETQHEIGVPRTQTSPPNFLDWRRMSHSFEAIGAYISILFPVNVSGQGDPLRLDAATVDSGVFATLGVRPAAGRVFDENDDRVGAPSVALLGHAIASGVYGDAAAAVGRTISLDDQPHTIVGVMPAGFAFPSRSAQLWRPLRFSPPFLASRSNHLLYAIARLRPGVSIERARAEMDVIGDQLRRAYPKENGRSGIGVATLRDVLSPQSRTLVFAVFGAALCLMLIACTNLASLLLARAVVRQPEIAVRIAIGATRARLARQFCAEHLAIVLSGGALGLLIPVVATRFLARLVPAVLPVDATPAIDWRVMSFAAALTLATTAALCLGPAWRAWRTADAQALRSRAPGSVPAGRLRAGLVLAEIAGTLLLLVTSGLLTKALWRVEAQDPGFRAEDVLTLRSALPMPKYGDAAVRRDFYSRVLTATSGLPGVVSAAYVSYHPMELASGRQPVVAPGFVDDPLLAPSAIIHFVTPGFFDTLGIPIRHGRDVSERDDAGALPVAVIGDSLAERLWPGQHPIGRHVVVSGVERTVVGVVRDIAVRTLEGAREPQIYFPAEQLGRTAAYYAPKDLVIRVSGDPRALGPALRAIVRDIDPHQAVSNLRVLAEIVAEQTAQRRDQVLASSGFAALACLLAAVGIHGLLSFAVAARTREVGVRVALGAARSGVLAMFLKQGTALGLAGIAVAVPLAYILARSMSALLFGVDPSDPVVYAASAALTLIMTVAGSVRPAMRAASVDPVVAIRSE